MTSKPGIVALTALFLLTACSKEEMVHGLTEPEANEIVYLLEAGGIKASKEREEGGRVIIYKVIVSAGDAHDARKVLVDNQLPRPKSMTLDKVYDPANKGLIPTATEEEAGYQMAVQGEIVSKLKTIPGVVEAHVTIVKPKRDVIRDLADKPPPATASITILFNKVEDKMPFKIEDVQRLVAGCVEGLDPMQVTVVASLNRSATTRMMNRPGDDDSGGGVDAARAPSAFGGFKVVDEGTKKKLNTMLMGGGIVLGLLLVAFIGVLVAFFGQRGALTKAQAELASKKKAQAAIAQPPPA